MHENIHIGLGKRGVTIKKAKRNKGGQGHRGVREKYKYHKKKEDRLSWIHKM